MNRNQIQIKVKQICHELVFKQGYISSIDVLQNLGYLTNENVKSWRFGKIPYLEKVCNTNLASLSFINKEIRQIAKELNLKNSLTVYMKYGKGVKIKLRFSKTGDENNEKFYSTHYIDENRITELKQAKEQKMKCL
jgi:hypothetical protein